MWRDLRCIVSGVSRAPLLGPRAATCRASLLPCHMQLHRVSRWPRAPSAVPRRAVWLCLRVATCFTPAVTAVAAAAVKQVAHGL
jgi:hypothetical protein